MSHRLCAVSSDYCSVCQNGLLPSAAATASNPLWPLAAPFLMTNCQPAPTKARLKCQHRMTKGPRGSSETNCVQYELILYSRTGPAGCGLLAAWPGRESGAPGPPSAACALGRPGSEDRDQRGLRSGTLSHISTLRRGGGHKPGMWDAGCWTSRAPPAPQVLSPMSRAPFQG